MLGRPIMWKQSGYTFYRPGALTIAATLSDLPFQFIQIVIFCIIVSPSLPYSKIREADRASGNRRSIS